MSRSDAILITGASGGIGSACARAFARDGRPLALSYHQGKAAVESLADELKASGLDVALFPADLADSAATTTLAKGIGDWCGGALGGWVHAAGGTRDGLAIGLSESDWDQVLQPHLGAAGRLLQRLTIAPGGFVTLIGSGAGCHGRVGQSAYGAAKAGVAALSQAMAVALGRKGVRINTVIPGPVPTAMWDALTPRERQRVLSLNAIDRLNSPQQVADFIVHLSRLMATSGQLFNLGSRVEGIW